MPQSTYRPTLEGLLVLCFLIALIIGCTGRAQASEPLPLQLEVSINGRNIGLIGSFLLIDGARIAAAPKELDSLGLRMEDGPRPEPVALDQLRGVSYSYDAARQAINIMVSDDRLKPQRIGPPLPERTSLHDSRLIGTVLNYGVTGAVYDSFGPAPTPSRPWLPRQLESLSLDSRVFGPYGTLTNSGYLGSGVANQDLFVRLDSTWSLSDPDALRTWRVGDVVTRGPTWARPVRLGGVEVMTDFSARPDVITAPLPTFRGSAAVPSTVDVFINNTKSYSQEVQQGPFVVSNIPTLTGAGSANIVIRDATGRETTQTVTFYNAPSLLRAGLFDYSIEAGFLRQNFGVLSDDYDGRFVSSASTRYGLTDALTLEAHTEFGAGLINAGFGASFSLPGSSLWSFAMSLSSYRDRIGAQGYAAFETNIGATTLHVSSQRTFGNYKDLAAVIEPDLVISPAFAPGLLNLDLDPPKALDVVSISFPLAEKDKIISLSLINRESADQSSRLLAASYTYPLPERSSLIVSGFHDIDTHNNGFYAAVSIPLGDLGQAQVGISHNKDVTGNHTGLAADYVKVAGAEPGNFGWQISENENNVANRTAAVTYQGSVARVQVGIDQFDNRVRGTATVDGAIVATTQGTFLSNRVNDAFAIVDVGAPGVDVLLENRRVATTDTNGRALVSGLRSYQSNKISIDPDKLPPGATAPDVVAQVAPVARGGAVVGLKASRADHSAVVVFTSADGKFIPVGAQGVLTGASQNFVVGYDGRAFIEGLVSRNAVTIEVSGKTCKATFDFTERAGAQVLIDRVICN